MGIAYGKIIDLEFSGFVLQHLAVRLMMPDACPSRVGRLFGGGSCQNKFYVR